MSTRGNCPIDASPPPIRDGEPETVVDHFETTPNLATFSLGFVISQFDNVNGALADPENLKDLQEMQAHNESLCIQIYSRREMAGSLDGVYDKVFKIVQSLKRYLATPFPVCAWKIVALPNVGLVRPANSYGLIVIR